MKPDLYTARSYKVYNKEEDAIILHHMRDVDKNINGEVLRRASWICKHYLPERSLYGVRNRWFRLLGKNRYIPNWENEVKDVVDLLSPDQRKRLKVRIMLPRSK
jgi:hypothetical protein